MPPAYEEKKALDGIINAAVFRAGLRDWARAEADSLAYLEVWPDGEDAARIRSRWPTWRRARASRRRS